MRCEQCEVMTINGIRCHETGCPIAYKDQTRECKECGSDFIPESNQQNCCDHVCYVNYNGLWCDCDECCGDNDFEENAERFGGIYTPSIAAI